MSVQIVTVKEIEKERNTRYTCTTPVTETQAYFIALLITNYDNV